MSMILLLYSGRHAFVLSIDVRCFILGRLILQLNIDLHLVGSQSPNNIPLHTITYFVRSRSLEITKTFYLSHPGDHTFAHLLIVDRLACSCFTCHYIMCSNQSSSDIFLWMYLNCAIIEQQQQHIVKIHYLIVGIDEIICTKHYLQFVPFGSVIY